MVLDENENKTWQYPGLASAGFDVDHEGWVPFGLWNAFCFDGFGIVGNGHGAVDLATNCKSSRYLTCASCYLVASVEAARQ